MGTLGGRRFVFVGVPPIGCLPIVRTLLGTGAEKCHENMNLLATSFNEKLIEVVRFLKNEPNTRATFIDIYTIIGTATIDPNNFGTLCYISEFFHRRRPKSVCTRWDYSPTTIFSFELQGWQRHQEAVVEQELLKLDKHAEAEKHAQIPASTCTGMPSTKQREWTKLSQMMW